MLEWKEQDDSYMHIRTISLHFWMETSVHVLITVEAAEGCVWRHSCAQKHVLSGRYGDTFL